MFKSHRRLLALVPLILLSGCLEIDDTSRAKQPGRVMIIGLDGARAEALDIATTPNLDRLRKMGPSDLNAITGDLSLSGPGWSSMLSGVWCDKHGVLDNDLSWEASNFDQYPHFISRVETARPGLNTVSISHWTPINDEILCAFETLDNCGRADKVINARGDAGVRDAVVDELTRGDPDVIFMQFDDIDHAGHGTAPASPPGGFCPYETGDVAEGEENGLCTPANYNPEYLELFQRTDGYIGDVLDALFRRPDYHAENWLIIVAPDHGGGGVVFNQHGFPHPQDRRIFLIFAGQRTAPFPEGVQLKIVDVAASALFHLHVPIEPDWQLDGQPIGLPDAPPYQDRSIPSCFDPTIFLPDSGRP